MAFSYAGYLDEFDPSCSDPDAAILAQVEKAEQEWNERRPHADKLNKHGHWRGRGASPFPHLSTIR